jgi:hypothetical protein
MARIYLLLALALVAMIVPAAAQNPQSKSSPMRGTPEDARNCRQDAVKFCKDVLDSDDAVLKCFQANREKLTPACQGVLKKYGK